MRFGVFGTGMVGQALATRLAGLGHEVMMGSRAADNPKAREWASASGGKTGTFADAARFGEILVSCTQGETSLKALQSVDPGDLTGKVLIDVSNPLDFSHGMPPVLSISNTDSLGETIQREFPGAKVVKALNTVNCQLMVNPQLVRGEHDIFLCGNDSGAKERVAQLLRDFGWQSIIDLGDIKNARATEQLMPIWLRLYGMFGTPLFNFRIVKT